MNMYVYGFEKSAVEREGKGKEGEGYMSMYTCSPKSPLIYKVLTYLEFLV